MQKKSKLTLPLIVIVVAAIAFVAYQLLRDTTGPEIALLAPNKNVSPKMPLQIAVKDAKSPIASVTVTMVANGERTVIFEERYDSENLQDRLLSFSLPEPLKPITNFQLELSATDNSWAGFGSGNTGTASYDLTMDIMPPQAYMKTPTLNIRHGGSGCVVFEASEPLAEAHVQIGDRSIKAYEVHPGKYAAIFPFPYYMNFEDFTPALMLTDLAGNTSATPISAYRLREKFTEDTLNISDSFLQQKAAEFRRSVPNETDPLKLYLAMNNQVRAENAVEIQRLADASVPRQLWADYFRRQPSKQTSRFADKRTYIYKGQIIDHQVHLGLDLASVQQDGVKASNNGIVVFADYQGIYGNCVVIDHGLGVLTLYAHLSSISVQKGQEVATGDIIAHTGATGLAGGDHLHFEVIVGGVSVTPIEWFDKSWVQNNITSKLDLLN